MAHSFLPFFQSQMLGAKAFREICGTHTMLGPVILLYSATEIVSVVMYICAVNPGASLTSVEVDYS